MNFFDGLFAFGASIVSWFFSLFPYCDPNLVSQFTTPFAWLVNNVMKPTHWFFPWEVFIQMMSLVIAAETVIFVIRLTRWIASMVTFGIVK